VINRNTLTLIENKYIQLFNNINTYLVYPTVWLKEKTLVVTISNTYNALFLFVLNFCIIEVIRVNLLSLNDCFSMTNS